MHSVFTDCPHREKLGWVEQLHFCFEALTNYDAEAHLRDMMHHMRQAQLPSGAIPGIVPEFCDFSGHRYMGDDDAFRFDVNWGGVIVHLPLMHYQEYGDMRVIEENLGAMKAFVAYLRSRERDDLIDFGLADWIALDAPRHVSWSRRRAICGFWMPRRDARPDRRQRWATALRARAAAVLHALDLRTRLIGAASQTELVILVDLAERRSDPATADRYTFSHALAWTATRSPWRGDVRAAGGHPAPARAADLVYRTSAARTCSATACSSHAVSPRWRRLGRRSGSPSARDPTTTSCSA